MKFKFFPSGIIKSVCGSIPTYVDILALFARSYGNLITQRQVLPHQPMVSTFLDLQKGPCHYFNRVIITSVFWPPFVTLVFFFLPPPAHNFLVGNGELPVDWWDAQLLASGTFERGEFRALELRLSQSRVGQTGWPTLSSQLWVWLSASLLCTFPAVLG